jgi:hypothetical protein
MQEEEGPYFLGAEPLTIPMVRTGRVRKHARLIRPPSARLSRPPSVTHYSYGEGALAHSTAFSYLFERGAAIDLEAHLPTIYPPTPIPGARRGSTAKERDLEAHPSYG